MRYGTFSYGKGVLYETPCYVDYRTGEDVEEAAAVNQRIAEVGWDNLRAEEKEVYLTGIGALRAEDLNRVEYRTREVLAMFYVLGYDNLKPEIKTNWMRTDLIRQSDMERIRCNIQSLLDTYNHNIGQPEITHSLKPNESDINALEEALKLLDKNMKQIAHGWYQYAGVTYAGGGIF